MQNKKSKVTLLPEMKSFHIDGGITLLEILEKASIHMDAPCGGKGLCGKCKILIKEGITKPTDNEQDLLTEAEIIKGFRLACQARPDTDIVIEIPCENRLDFKKIYSSKLKGNVKSVSGGFSVSSDFKKIFLSLKKPALTDQRSDWERIKEELLHNGTHISRNLKPSIEVLRKMPGLIRDADYDITVTICNHVLLDIEEGNTTAAGYGMAFDIGTTTIAGYLIDLAKGEELSIIAKANPQIIYGDDVITRIGFTQENENCVQKLQSVMIEILNEIIGEAIEKAQVKRENIYKIAISGNTTMHHLLLGLEVASLAASPYIPVIKEGMTLKARELSGINLPSNTPIYFLPNISAFVGGDITAGILSSGLWKKDQTVLFVDLGTNGEIVLGNKDRIWACSAAAGPAFEGARISSGMRAAAGAMDRVELDKKQLIYHVIKDGKIRGICGSGLIDLVAQMLNLGLLDKTGRLIDQEQCRLKVGEEVSHRIIKDEKKNQFLLVNGNETHSGFPLFITQKDIREVQLAKAAIFAGIKILLKEANLQIEDIDEILLAGAFGNFINKESAKRLGLIPPLALNKIESIGHAAGRGAEMVLLSDKSKKNCEDFTKEVAYIELSSRKDFQKEFIDAMFF